MTYRSLLVYLDDSTANRARSSASIQLAKALDAHLVGLAPTGSIGASNATQAMALDTLRDEAEQATDRFRSQCRAAGLKSYEVVTPESDSAASLVRHAQTSDLVLLTQPEPGMQSLQDIVQQVVLGSARPSLVLPHAKAVKTLGTRVMVAWNDSREATRALTDALPMLRLAQSVQVVCWNDGQNKNEGKPGSNIAGNHIEGDPKDHKEGGQPGRTKAIRARLDALQPWLMRHGVSAELHLETLEGELARSLLARAASHGTDLIVIGAQGRDRDARPVMGSTTRALLMATTVPLLISH